VQADPNWQQVNAAVDFAGLPRRCLMSVVDGAFADAYAQQIAHQFHHAAVRTVSYQNKPCINWRNQVLVTGSSNSTSSSGALEEKILARAALASFACWQTNLRLTSCPAAKSVFVAVPANADLTDLTRGELEVIIVTLWKRLAALETKVDKNLSNSSKPPSSNGFVKKALPLREASGKQAGGELDHKGAPLKRVEQPTETVSYRLPKQCDQ